MPTVAPATLAALLRSRLRARLLMFVRSSFSRDSLSILHGRMCQRQDLEYLMWIKITFVAERGCPSHRGRPRCRPAGRTRRGESSANLPVIQPAVGQNSVNPEAAHSTLIIVC